MDRFEIATRQAGAVSVVSLRGYLDAHTAPEFEQVLQTLVDEKHVRIVVNCSGLNYISSAGLGVFMGFIENVRSQNGDIKLAELTDKVFRVFDLLGFPVLFEILKREEDALAKFEKT
ncbi:STAS domain-containing protein [bacterium]|nr:STAS domain-containing protein [bacterium]